MKIPAESPHRFIAYILKATSFQLQCKSTAVLCTRPRLPQRREVTPAAVAAMTVAAATATTASAEQGSQRELYKKQKPQQRKELQR